MKRLLILILAALLLCGCNGPGSGAEESTPPSTAPTRSTLPPDPGTYMAGSVAERDSSGAIRVYDPGIISSRGLRRVGENVALFSADGPDAPSVTVQILTGENCAVARQGELTSPSDPEGPGVALSDKGLAYYDEAAGEVVILDSKLAEKDRVALPEDRIGSIAISSDLRTVYYCTSGEIRALEVNSGISRLLRQHNCQWQSIEYLCFDDSVLVCHIVQEDESYYGFISTETGELLDSDADLMQLDTLGQQYFLQRTDATVRERLFGSLDGAVSSLLPSQTDAAVYSLLEMNSVLTAAAAEDKLMLELYSLESGKKTASAWLQDVSSVSYAASDSRYVWLVGYDIQREAELLYRWDVSQSAVEDDGVYTQPRSSEENPDEEGLAQYQIQADALGEKYGVSIRLREIVPPDDYELTEEYQVSAFASGLDALEAALSRFPEGFFDTAAKVTKSGKLNISLVRQISHEVNSLQYWADGDAYIALTIGDAVEQNFYHELCHVLDSYVHAYSTKLDTWDALNPGKFTYDNNYNDYLTRQSTQYLEGEDRAFIDSYSMTYPMEDRARIFEYAMLPGNETYFTSGTMQEKLERLCEAIRDAYGWKKDSRAFPWEQYLQTPLAKTE